MIPKDRRRRIRSDRGNQSTTDGSEHVSPTADVALTVSVVAVGVALTVMVLLLYFRTAARSIVLGDNPELVTTAVTLGVAHPPGYPLLVLVGHLFSLLPLGPVAFRVNLVAVVCGSATVALVYLTAWRLSHRWPAALLAAGTLAVNPLFWSWSLAF